MSKFSLLIITMAILANTACASDMTKPSAEEPPDLMQLKEELADFYDVPTQTGEFKLNPDKHSIFLIDRPQPESLSINSKEGVVAVWQWIEDKWTFAGWLEGASKTIDLYKGINGFSVIALRPLGAAVLVDLGILMAPPLTPPPVVCGTQTMRGYSSDWYTQREVCDLPWIATLEESAAKRDGRNRCAAFCSNMKCTASIPTLRARASACVTVAANHHTRSARTDQFTCTCVKQ